MTRFEITTTKPVTVSGVPTKLVMSKLTGAAIEWAVNVSTALRSKENRHVNDTGSNVLTMSVTVMTKASPPMGSFPKPTVVNGMVNSIAIHFSRRLNIGPVMSQQPPQLYRKTNKNKSISVNVATITGSYDSPCVSMWVTMRVVKANSTVVRAVTNMSLKATIPFRLYSLRSSPPSTSSTGTRVTVQLATGKNS